MPETNNQVRDILAVMVAESVEQCSLSDREFMLIRLAALVASDAPAASYLFNAAAAAESDVSLEDVQDVLVALAPIVGTARIVTATNEIAKGLGYKFSIIGDRMEATLAANGA